MTIDLNAFGQSTAKGKLEQTPTANIFSARVTAGSSVTLKPGMAVEIDASDTTKMLAVKPLTSTGTVFGFIPLVHKNNAIGLTATTTDVIEVAADNAVMVMEASEAIAKGSLIKYDYSTLKVGEADTAADAVVGIALEAAAADGDLLKVLIKTPNVPAVVPAAG